MSSSKATADLIGQLLTSVGHYVHLETVDGMRREGKVTAFTTRRMDFNGRPLDWPDELELNADPQDHIPLARVLRLTVF